MYQNNRSGMCKLVGFYEYLYAYVISTRFVVPRHIAYDIRLGMLEMVLSLQHSHGLMFTPLVKIDALPVADLP